MDDGRFCAFNGACPVFEERLAQFPGMSELFRKRYCETDHTQCVRHILADEFGVRAVPATLMPNDHREAQRVRLGLN